MSTCLKVIFKQLPDGLDVRVGFDETPDATETEKNLAEIYARAIYDHFREHPAAEDLTKKTPKEVPNDK